MRCSEPATDAYRAIDDLKQDVTDIIQQRDAWIARYQKEHELLNEALAEADYWQAVASGMEE